MRRENVLFADLGGYTVPAGHYKREIRTHTIQNSLFIRNWFDASNPCRRCAQKKNKKRLNITVHVDTYYNICTSLRRSVRSVICSDSAVDYAVAPPPSPANFLQTFFVVNGWMTPNLPPLLFGTPRQVMLRLEETRPGPFASAVAEARADVMAGLGAASMESYQRAYPFLLKLHSLRYIALLYFSVVPIPVNSVVPILPRITNAPSFWSRVSRGTVTPSSPPPPILYPRNLPERRS